VATGRPALTRRKFIEGSVATGLGALVGCREDSQSPSPKRSTLTKAGHEAPLASPLPVARPAKHDDAPAVPPIPRRPFGKTGVDVPALTLAASFEKDGSRLMMSRAIDLGVTIWDTASEYRGGNEERGIGAFLERYPEQRERVIVATKSRPADPVGLEANLENSLAHLNLKRIDVFMLHGVEDPAAFTPAVQAWVKRQKAAGRIGLFGFSCHKEVPRCLEAAALLDWVDMAMVAYNYRLFDDAPTQKALDACHQAGMGLIAMKFRGFDSNDAVLPMEKSDVPDLSTEAIKLRALLADKRIASVCVYVPNLSTLGIYAEAARRPEPLNKQERDFLRENAALGRRHYCAGCAHLCEPVAGGAPISDVARLMMYQRAYDDPKRARDEFARLPAARREGIEARDYREAERRCPKGVPIAVLMKRAARELV
jgi:uncharacterized protein